jgi:hypothetical protein
MTTRMMICPERNGELPRTDRLPSKRDVSAAAAAAAAAAADNDNDDDAAAAFM